MYHIDMLVKLERIQHYENVLHKPVYYLHSVKPAQEFTCIKMSPFSYHVIEKSPLGQGKSRLLKLATS
jgi:hypothetical protein